MASCSRVWRLARFLSLLVMQAVLGICQLVNASTALPGVSAYVAGAGFPTSAFSSYYESPALPTSQPQPIVYDPVLDITFPYGLTNPDIIPESSDEVYFPLPKTILTWTEKQALINAVVSNVTEIINSTDKGGPCAKCKKALVAAKPAALFTPLLVPNAMVNLCKTFGLYTNETCEENFLTQAFGSTWTQVLALADVEGQDGDYICYTLGPDFCPEPLTRSLDTSKLFPKPKPEHVQIPKASGRRVKVLHMSDIHLDPRYAISSEANCTSGLCCRSDNFNNLSMSSEAVLPASPYGYFKCDVPYDLALAALQAVGPLTGTNKGACGGSLAWSIYTGDVASHDPELQMSRDYIEYTETSVFDMFKHYLSGPVFAALGNHDSSPANIDAPDRFPGPLGDQLSWNYNHFSSLWQHEGWISHETAEQARTHYGGYSVKTHYKLRVIAFNTDLWYKRNFLNLVNTTEPDNSGVFSWMVQELQNAEDNGERVWLIGHVPSGWDGNNPMPDPTNLFYQIVGRYSPHVIAEVFFGHNHEDQFMIFYANNGTVQNADTALATGWLGPSVTPLTNVNSAFRLYEVDTGNFNVYEAYTFFSNVSEYSSLRNKGPTFQLEYSTRETYGLAAGWDKTAPLNATFWHRLTEAMEEDRELVTLQNYLQGRKSVKSPICDTPECQEAKICYMRSGSTALGSQCPQGYGSVQSPFKKH